MVTTRRTFLGACGAGILDVAAATSDAVAGSGRAGQTDLVAAWRQQFPALEQRVNGHPLAYLDSAATTLRPRPVIEALARFDRGDNANPAATLHTLARRSAASYAQARERVARFLNAAAAAEVVFTKGTTEAINLVAATWGVAHVSTGDEILVTTAEHYSNLLPWRALAARVGARVVTVDVGDDGRLDVGRVAAAFNARTRLLAFSHVSNVLGLINPAGELCQHARARGIATLVDAAQSAPHVRLDVQAIGCDFLCCSGHKLLGPMGTGVLWARQSTLDGMPPYHLGSNMAHEVDDRGARFEAGALKYQAGTPDVSGALGLAAAIETLEHFGMDAVRRHDADLVRHFRQRVDAVSGLQVLGTIADVARLPVFTFTMRGVAAPTIVKALDEAGVAVRAGDMAALPLLERFGVTEAVRASCYVYTTTAEIDRLFEVLRILRR